MAKHTPGSFCMHPRPAPRAPARPPRLEFAVLAQPLPPVDAFGVPHLLALLATALTALGLSLGLRRTADPRVE